MKGLHSLVRRCRCPAVDQRLPFGQQRLREGVLSVGVLTIRLYVSSATRRADFYGRRAETTAHAGRRARAR